MKRLVTASFCLAAGAALLLPALAHPASPMAVQGTATATLTVTAHVVRNCTLSVTAIDFGNYDALVANLTQPLDGVADVTVHCTKGTGVKLEADNGANANGTQRRMASGTEFLEYELFSEAGRTNRWGTGSEARTVPAQGTNAPAVPSASGGVAMQAFGRVLPGQNVTSGDYTDTITVTVTF